MPQSEEGEVIFAGLARRDITPPLGIGLMGMADPTQIAQGIHTRLYATALVLMDRAEHKVAIVTCDVLAGTQGLRTEVLKRIQGRGFEERNILLCGTHTHSGPGGYFLYLLYNFGIGLKPSILYFLADQIAQAVCDADDGKVPAVLGVGYAPLSGVTRNRSIEAHLANHGLLLERGEGSPEMDPYGPLHPIDGLMRVMRIDRVVGNATRPMGVFANFAVHGTLLKHDNHLVSGDIQGIAAHLVEQQIESEGFGYEGPTRVLCAYSNGAEGDISPCVRDGYRGVGYNSYSDAEIAASTQATAIVAAHREAGSRLASSIEIDTRFAFIRLDGQQILGTERLTSPYAGFGFPMIGGAEDGPSLFHDLLHTEGTRQAQEDPYQGSKIVLFKAYPGYLAPWVVPLQIFRIGTLLLAAVPGEPTVEVGRRIAASIMDGLASVGVEDVWIVGLANEYADYFTTPEEYSLQHYEGGSTLYGPWSSLLLEQEFSNLADAMARGVPDPETTVRPPDMSIILRLAEKNEKPIPCDALEHVGTIMVQATDTARFDIARFSWVGGNPSSDHHPDEAFVTIQREVAPDVWEDFLWDGRLGLVVTVTRRDGLYVWEAHWETKKDTPVGKYRFRVSGAAQGTNGPVPYHVASDPFSIEPSDRVHVISVERLGQKRVVIRAAYPEPDPSINFLVRDRYVPGGSLNVSTGGASLLPALYDPGEGGFVLTLEGNTSAARLYIEQGALRDPYGNYNGQPCRLDVP